MCCCHCAPEKGKDVAVHQVSDKSDDDSGPLPRFERYRDIDDLPIDANTGQDNDDEMDYIDSDYDDYDNRNLRMDDWMSSLWLMYYWYLM